MKTGDEYLMNVSKKTIIIRIISLLAVVATAVAIFSFSAQPAEESKKVSDKVVEFVEKSRPLDAMMPDKKSEKSTRVREYAHMLLYLVLGVSGGIFAFTFDIRLWIKPLGAAAFCLLYSLSDEFHQRFVDGRAFELKDLLMDAAGYLAGIAIVAAVCYIIIKKAKKFRRNSI